MFIDKKNSIKIVLINYLIALLPLSLILGNFAVNLNIIIICLIGLWINGKNNFLIKDKLCHYFIYSFFFYLIIITFINNIEYFETNYIYKTHFLKSIYFLRYLIFFLVINKLAEKNMLNLKYFFYSATFFVFLLGIDILIQVFIGKNLLGYKITANRPSGFFGDEHIAGGYFQRFVFFLIFLLIIKLRDNFKRYTAFILLSFMFLVPIILTGNRMPMLIYVASCLIFLILEKKFKEIILFFLLCILTTSLILKFQLVSHLNVQLTNFYTDTRTMIVHGPKLFYLKNYDHKDINFRSGYLIHFNSGIQIWKKNKIFGNGLKSLPVNCKYRNNQTCNSHPHNYFIQILMDAGIVGLLLIYTVFFIGFLKFLKFYFFSNDQKTKYFFFPFFIITFFEFFPLRSSGSFFSTSNSVVIFFMLAVLLNFQQIKKYF